MTTKPFVSILILTHNAPDYVRITLDSVTQRTEGVDYEIVVVDNASELETRELVTAYHDKKLADKLFLSPTNTLFAAGNNIAATLAAPEATHFLLLNSDIEVHSPSWLAELLAVHKPGITALKIHDNPKRVDGWCLLVDAPLFRQYKLDETHQWWWAVTKFQANLLADGYTVQGVRRFGHLMTHFGGKSGMGFKGAKGMDVSMAEAKTWFKGKSISEVAIKGGGGVSMREWAREKVTAVSRLGRRS